MTTRIKLRSDTAANWTASNPILAAGEPGLETDTRKLKYGNGTSTWTTLTYGGGLSIGPDGQIYVGDGTTDGGSYNSIAIGTNAGIDQSWSTVALGNEAGSINQGPSAIAIGRSAGEEDQDWNGIAIGRYAGNFEQGEETVAIGKNSGNYQQSQHAIAIGMEAGNYQQGIAAVSIGEEAGRNEQGFRGVAVGRWAGEESQGQQAVAVGALAGRYNQRAYAVAIGRHAGYDNQGEYAIAIGQEAGAGSTNDSGDYVSKTWVSGGQSGSSTFVVNNVTDIMTGMQAVGTNLSDCFVTAINTLTNEITISPGTSGDLELNTPNIDFYGHQGDYSIAIGAYASSRHQHDNSIVINSTGNELRSAGTGTVVIKTVRAVSNTADFYPCYYNPTTGELVYVTGV